MLKISKLACLFTILHLSAANPTMRTTAKETEARLIINENVRHPVIATGHTKSFIDAVSTSHITIDKTRLIYEILSKYDNIVNSEYQTILLTGPRKWGKTTNLLMLHDYLQQYVHTFKNSNENDRKFGDWSIGEDGKSRYRKYHGVLKSDIGNNGRFFLNGTLNNNQTLKSKFLISEYQNFSSTYLGKFPVLYISFGEITGLDYETFTKSLETLIPKALEPYNNFIQDAVDSANGKYESEMRGYEYDLMCGCMDGKHCNLKMACEVIGWENSVIILIDDYDEPINRALLHPQFKEADRYRSLEFYCDILQETLRDNYCTRLKIMSGTYRWSGHHRSLSAFKNIVEYNYLDSEFSQCFGINQREFDLLCEYLSIPGQKKTEIKNWFNGYRTGKKKNLKIYNPFSIAKYLHGAKFKDNEEGENNNIVDILLPQFLKDQKFLDNFVRLLSGHTITADIGNLTFTPEPNSDSETNSTNSGSLPQIPYIESAFKFMLAAGYLTDSTLPPHFNGNLSLQIPNAEIRCRLRKLFRSHLETYEKGIDKRSQNLLLHFKAFALNDESRSRDLEEAIYHFLDCLPLFVNETLDRANESVTLAKLQRNENLVTSLPNWIAAISEEFEFQRVNCVLDVDNTVHHPYHVFMHKSVAIICDVGHDDDATIFATLLDHIEANTWPKISIQFHNEIASVSRVKFILAHVSQNKTTKVRGKMIQLNIHRNKT